MNIVFIYDETGGVPESIRRIIATERFGDIVRRKRKLVDSIRGIVEDSAGCEFIRISDNEDVPTLIERIRKYPAEQLVFRLPSSVVPLSLDIFSALIGKLPYALDQVVYGEPGMNDAPALLYRDHAIALLTEREPAGRSRFFSLFEPHAMRIGNQVQFVDISAISPFLAFMSGATEARHFNSTERSGGVFHKRSSDKKKIRGEYMYFHVVDEEMKRFLLPTFGYSEDADSATYAMEHLSVPDAAMQIVHNTFNESSFTALLDSFLAFVEARGTKIVGVDDVKRIGQRDIVGKLDKRFEQLLDTPVGQRLAGVLENSGPHGTLVQMVERCRRFLAEGFDRSDIDYLALGHGDPCFSNILYNPEINLFRLIDPRGAETREDAFMHPLYDLAKFSHSVMGGYDFVNGGLSECLLNPTMQLTLVLERGGPPAWMKHIFRSRLEARGWDVQLVRAIEASLFLSMLPLHIDSPEKLPAFCLIAGDILSELETRRD